MASLLMTLCFDVPNNSYFALGPGEPNPPRGATYDDGNWYTAHWGHLSPESYAQVEGGMARLKAVSIDHSPLVFGGTMVNQGRASHLAVQLGHFKGSNTTYEVASPTPRIIFKYGEYIPGGRLWLDVRARILDRAKMNYENVFAQANLGFNFQFQPEYRDGAGNVVLEDYDNPDFQAGNGKFPKVVHFDVFLSSHIYDWTSNEYERPVGWENRGISYRITPDADLHVQRVEGQMPNKNTWYSFHIDLGYAINRALQMTEDHYFSIPWGPRPILGFYTLNRLILRNIQLYTEASGGLIEAQIDRAFIYTPYGNGGQYCPFVYSWNGKNYVVDNNILPRAELSNGADVEDYYRLEQTLVPKNGKYSLLLSEFESEHSYVDQAQLLAVDHNPDVRIAFTPTGELLTYKNPTPPISAIDDDGLNRLNEIRLMDGNVSDPATYFQGYSGDYLVLNFGQVNPSTAKLIIRDDQKKMFECILVQIRGGDGVWQTVETLVPRAYWSMEAVNLSPYVVQGQDLLVRLYWKFRHRLDFIGLDTTPQDNYEIRYGNLVSATHSTQGDIKPLLLYSDSLYAELIPGQQIQLEFTLPNNSKPARTYVFYTKGHYYTIP